MAEYTEGEWYKESGDDDTFGYDIYYIHANGGKMVCEGICNPHDADLLVSAKDMLEALEAIATAKLTPKGTAWQNWNAAKLIALKAIKRAKGES